MKKPALMAATDTAARKTGDKIGEILVATGRLSAENALRVTALAHQNRLPFGDAGVVLKLLSRADVDFALSKQFGYAWIQTQDAALSPHLVAAYQPFGRTGENLRAVRSQIMLRWFNTHPLHKMVAVVSPNAGDGRSFIASNLAVVFSQQGQRTLLIDGDLRSNAERGQGSLFRLATSTGLSTILAGRAGLEIAQAIPGLPGLTVLPAGAVPPNPQELLGRLGFTQLLSAASQEFDVVVMDTPGGADFADADIIASRAGAAVMVARKDRSKTAAIQSLAQRLQECDVTLLGSVLNGC
jgi:receptor protein-tyrosine kinase